MMLCAVGVMAQVWRPGGHERGSGGVGSTYAMCIRGDYIGVEASWA